LKRIIFLFFLLTAFTAFSPGLWSQGAGGVQQEEPIEINFSAEGGFYLDELELEINAPGSSVYYTLDGSRPTTRSAYYSKPILIQETTVVRVLAYRHKKQTAGSWPNLFYQ
jgi:hypothetical protein